MSYFLRSERLGFREWSKEDLPLAVELWGDPRVTEWIDSRSPLTPEQAKAKLYEEIESREKWGVQYWPIFLLEDDSHVGCCGLHPYNPEIGILELGFHIRSDLWGQGFATEAARTVIALAFQGLKIPGLFAGHHPKNTASHYLLRKLGFHHTHDELYEPTGLDHPSYLLSAEEYRAPAKAAPEGKGGSKAKKRK